MPRKQAVKTPPGEPVQESQVEAEAAAPEIAGQGQHRNGTNKELTIDSPVIPDLGPAKPLTMENLQAGPRKGRVPTEMIPQDRVGWRLGEFVRKLIISKGWTREVASERTGMTAHAINHIISGYVDTPEPKNVRRLADGLGVTPLDIWSHSSLVTEDDVMRFMANQLADSRVSGDATWIGISNIIGGMPDAERQATLKAVAAIVGLSDNIQRLAARRVTQPRI